MMAVGTIFLTNRSQAVRIPAEARFPDDVKHVIVHAVGPDRILAPAERAWDGFFQSAETVTADFIIDRLTVEAQPGVDR